MMKLRVLIVLLLLVATLVAGCGSKSKSASTTTTASNLPAAAQTSDQWASRVVDWFLRPLNPDLAVVGNFANSQVRFYIETQNQQALNTIYARMSDLQRCDEHLARVGPPPGDDQQLKAIDGHFRQACTAYANVGARITRFAVTGRLPLFAVVTAPGTAAKIQSIKDLEGKSVGVSALGNADHALTLYLLKQAGADAQKVQFTTMGVNLLEALRQGQIDAGLVQNPRKGIIVSGEAGDFFALALFFAWSGGEGL